MTRRIVLLAVALVAPLLVVAPATPAEALVAPFPGSTSEVQSEFGEGVLAGTSNGLLIVRPKYGVVQRWRFGQDPTLVDTEPDPRDVAWDPTTADAIVATADRVGRIPEGGQWTTIASVPGIVGVDVDASGRVYVLHYDANGAAVDRLGGDGVLTEVARASNESVFAFAVTPDGDPLLAHANDIVRFSDGVGTTIFGQSGIYCFPPSPCGDEGPAIAGRAAVITALEVGVDGSIYFAEHDSERVRVIRPDGFVHNLLGSYEACMKVERSDCLPGFGARSAMQHPLSIALSGDHLFVIDQDDVRRWTRLLQVHGAGAAPVVEPQGYRMIARDGGVFSFGWASFHGSTGDIRLASPIVAGRSNGDAGYWFVAGDGGVFTFGDATFLGSAAGRTTSPVVDMAVRRDGRGYVVVERDGTVHPFGTTMILDSSDARPFAAVVNVGSDRYRVIGERPSSLPTLNVPIVAAHSTTSGNGIWYVASDGGVFTEGDAGFFGSTGNLRLNQPVLDLIPTPTERGYWLIAADGGVFTFGDAAFFGSMGAVRLNQPVVAGVAGPVPSG